MCIVKSVGVVLSVLFVLAISGPAVAFDSGSTGADGPLVISESTQLQLPDNGVFNFTTFTVEAGAILTFVKNADNTPVTILTTGDVVIDGVVNIDGGHSDYLAPGVGGPGGFDGGVGPLIGKDGGNGSGPGGGYGAKGHTDEPARYCGAGGGGGSYATTGGVGDDAYCGPAIGGSFGHVYGNKRLLPLIGGSGGGAGGGIPTQAGGGGGGGGGAILIASSTKISFSGKAISANGGQSRCLTGSYNGCYTPLGGGGSGGAIRLMAPVVDANGTLSAIGGVVGRIYYGISSGEGGDGYIHIEYEQFQGNPLSSPLFSGGPLYYIEPPNMPSLKIISVDGVNIDGSPGGNYGSPDVLLPFTTKNPIDVVILAQNIEPVGTIINLKALPAVGSSTSVAGTLVGSQTSSTVNIPINISTTHPSVLTAHVTVDVVAAFGRPMFIEGESVAQVRFESTVGQQGSSVTLITESGREIPYTM